MKHFYRWNGLKNLVKHCPLEILNLPLIVGGDVYNRPHPLALKLTYHICKSGCHIANELVIVS